MAFVLLEAHRLQVDIKKSRFIVDCVPLQSVEEIPARLAALHQSDATHNCWAWRFGERYRFNDDGEPGGSAGRPMLQAIEGQACDCVLAHVVRYFGGIKLGVGGLVRAYGNGVAECLRCAAKREQVAMTVLRFQVDFSDSHAVYGVISQEKLLKSGEVFGAEGVCFELTLPVSELARIRAKVMDACRARLKWLES